MNSIIIPQALLVFSMVLLGASIRKMIKSNEPKLFQIIFAISFLLAFPISGLVHLSLTSNNGYFSLNQNGLDYLSWQSSSLVIVFTLILIMTVSIFRKRTKIRDRPSLNRAPSFETSIVFSVPLLLLGSFASNRLNSVLSDRQSNRVIAVAGGNARFAYFAVWGVWGAIILSTAILNRWVLANSFRYLIILVTVVVIFQMLSWSGARLMPLVFSAAFVYGNKDYLKKIRRVAFPIAFAGYLVFAIIVTNQRKINYSGGQRFSMLDLLDWEAGRFSMIGGAIWTVNHNGYLKGESFVFTWNILLSGLQKLLELPLQIDTGNTRSISQSLGNGIMGSDTVNYIAPGMLVELFLNFGIMGSSIGLVICLYVLSRLHEKMNLSTENTGQILYFYLGASTIFCFLIASSMSLLGYFLFYPLPIFVLYLSSLSRRAGNLHRNTTI